MAEAQSAVREDRSARRIAAERGDREEEEGRDEAVSDRIVSTVPEEVLQLGKRRRNQSTATESATGPEGEGWQGAGPGTKHRKFTVQRLRSKLRIWVERPTRPTKPVE